MYSLQDNVACCSVLLRVSSTFNNFHQDTDDHCGHDKTKSSRVQSPASRKYIDLFLVECDNFRLHLDRSASQALNCVAVMSYCVLHRLPCVAERPAVQVVGGDTAPFYTPQIIYHMECRVSAVPAADVEWFTVPCSRLGCVSSEPEWQSHNTPSLSTTEVTLESVSTTLVTLRLSAPPR